VVGLSLYTWSAQQSMNQVMHTLGLNCDHGSMSELAAMFCEPSKSSCVVCGWLRKKSVTLSKRPSLSSSGYHDILLQEVARQ
jgi:hypothetical protein